MAMAMTDGTYIPTEADRNATVAKKGRRARMDQEA